MPYPLLMSVACAALMAAAVTAAASAGAALTAALTMAAACCGFAAIRLATTCALASPWA